VDDDGEFGVASESHLIAKYLVLDVAWGVIIVIIQSDFAPSDYFGMFCELREFFEVLRGGLLRFVRMNPNAGVYLSAYGSAESSFSGPGPVPIARRAETPATRARSNIASRSSANWGKSM
jgi:hypothetical protein